MKDVQNDRASMIRIAGGSNEQLQIGSPIGGFTNGTQRAYIYADSVPAFSVEAESTSSVNYVEVTGTDTGKCRTDCDGWR